MTKKLRKEDPSINFRLPKELRVRILKEADFHNMTVSEYLRDHMETFLNGDLYREELEYYENNAFINSTEFLQLVVWMYQKRKDNVYSELDKQFQNRYIETIKKIQDNLPLDLKDEFEKILFDLMRVKREDAYRYRFAQYSVLDKTNFDFKKLEDYLLTIPKQRKETLHY
jgi:hypothetical protein